LREQLRIYGVPVGSLLGAGSPAGPPEPAGSCIVVVATDAPLRAEQLERVARRAGLGLARTGSVAHHGSGEIFLALSTARGEAALSDSGLNPLFAATVDATEQAVVNALWAAERVVGRAGRVAPALPPRRRRSAARGPPPPLRRGRLCAKSARKPPHDVSRSCSIAHDHKRAQDPLGRTRGAPWPAVRAPHRREGRFRQDARRAPPPLAVAIWSWWDPSPGTLAVAAGP
jgi:hypothetical protein